MPVEIGTSVRHVDQRYITPYNDVYMDEYTVFDAYMFIDFERPWWAPSVDKDPALVLGAKSHQQNLRGFC